MAPAHLAIMASTIVWLLGATVTSHAAPVPQSGQAVDPGRLVEPTCHRGWHHRSGRPCSFGGPATPYYGGPRYMPGPGYGYGRHGRRCRWVYNPWGQAVRVCRW